MKKSVQISIPTPCHEKWSSFKTTAQGGFCSSCEKEVIDFTTWSEDRLKLYFRNLQGHACGRFRPEQLKVYNYEQPRRNKLGWAPVVLVGSLIAMTSEQTAAQSTAKPLQTTEQFQTDVKLGLVRSTDSLKFRITGVVKWAEDSTVLPGVNVARKGTNESTVTDEAGRFTFEMGRTDSSETLVFAFIGMKTVEYPVNQITENIVISLYPDETRLGGIMVGGIVATRRISPRRWWWTIKSWF